MEYRQFGRTGTRVSELCLGTMTFGNEADEATSRQIVDRFVDAGGNFIDTANVYSQGVSEEITGRAIKGKRDEIVLATKARFAMGGDTNAVGSSRRNLRAGVRGVAAPARHRVDRPLPGAHVGQAHAARGDAVDPRRPRARGQGPLHRCEQLRRLAPGQGPRGQRAARLGAVRVPPARVLAHHPRRGARAHPAVPERGPRRHPVEPARRRHPHRQVPEGRRLPDRHARRRHREPDHVHLPARRPRVEHRRRGDRRPRRRPGRARRRSRSTGCCTGAASPRRSSAPAT